MKNRFAFDFFARKKFQKKEVRIFDNDIRAEEKTTEQAKIINLYKKDIPALKQAKIISMFS